MLGFRLLDNQTFLFLSSESEFGKVQCVFPKAGVEFPRYTFFLHLAAARRRNLLLAVHDDDDDEIFFFSSTPWLMIYCADSDAAALTRSFLKASFVSDIPRVVTTQRSKGS